MLEGIHWNDELPPEMLLGPDLALSEEELDWLWIMFTAIGTHWKEAFPVNLLRSRWLDMIESYCGGDPSYVAEYKSAGATYKSLTEELGPQNAAHRFYGETVITHGDAALTRLLHAKYFVATQFIGCFLAAGGYRAFVPAARNYAGFMGGSRFKEWPPVRTGGRR